MPKAKLFLLPSTVPVGSISFEMSQINAGGCPEFPVLCIPAEISLTAAMTTPKPQAIHPISLISMAGELASPAYRVIARFHDEIGLTAGHPHAAEIRHYRFEIPLDLRTVNELEKDRTGDLQCSLILRPLLGIHNTNLNNGGAQSFSVGGIDTLAFSIPQSHWVGLLPRFGYGGLELLEVRYGTGLTAFHLPKSVEEIQLAKKYLREHDWDKAATHCRRAVEVILDSRSPSLPPQTPFRIRVETFIGDHLKGIHDRQARLLSEQMRIIWEVTSQVTHANPQPPCTREEAEFIVRATMALVEYFSKLIA
jgi:hypothetical protein